MNRYDHMPRVAFYDSKIKSGKSNRAESNV